MFGFEGEREREHHRKREEERRLEREGVNPMTARVIATQDNFYNQNMANAGRQLFCDSYAVNNNSGPQFPLAGYQQEQRTIQHDERILREEEHHHEGERRFEGEQRFEEHRHEGGRRHEGNRF